MACSVVSFINFKGGVGKTTLCTGIAKSLVDLGHSVLVIDADPQFNATYALLGNYEGHSKKQNNLMNTLYFSEFEPKRRTIIGLFPEEIEVQKRYTPPSAVDLLYRLRKRKPAFDLLCGDVRLMSIYKYYRADMIDRIHDFIRQYALRDKYEYILIDCPPTISTYSVSALAASDYYIVPYRLERYSIPGLYSLRRVMDHIVKTEDLELKPLGLIRTMVVEEYLAKQEESEENICQSCGLIDFDLYEEEWYNELKFKSKLRYKPIVQSGTSGPLPNNYTRTNEDIKNITNEFVERIEKNEKTDDKRMGYE